MTNFVPIFPLSLVVYPGEDLNLHIFEPRYRQLVRECLSERKAFGIPTIIGKDMREYGTLVEITAVDKEYDNGNMDIRTRGLRVFRMLEVIREVPDKLYAGAIVHYPRNDKRGNAELMQYILLGIRQLHKLLKVTKAFGKPDGELLSYDIAHHSGMSLEEEYDLLCLLHERQRQEYLRRHLSKVLPMMVEMEALKERVKLNGHFRSLSSGSF